MTQVIINDIFPYTQIIATNGQTVFSTNPPWTANFSTDIIVYQTLNGSIPNDEIDILTPNQYSVAFIGDSQTVQITLVTAASSGDKITIIRNTPADRENLYSNTNFTPSMLNNDFGILTLVDQQAQLVNQRIAPRYNYTANISVPTDTILPILDANQSWVKNGNNNQIIGMTISTSAGSGTVNVGVANQLAWYAANGSAIQGFTTQNSSVLTTSSIGAPTWASQLGMSLGGTGASLVPDNGAIVYSNASSLALLSHTTTQGLALLSGNASAPRWSTNKPITQINKILINTTSTYFPSVGIVYIECELIGGGAGGGGVQQSGAGANGVGGGGGAGGYSKGIFTADQLGNSAAVTIGSGGLAGVAAGGTGGNGGTTSLTLSGTGTLTIQAIGGTGGTGTSASSSGTYVGGGSGGGSSGGYLNINGNSGGNGGTGNSAGSSSGIGAGSLYGASVGISAFDIAGKPGLLYGSGGSGGAANATTNRAGGAGSQGAVIIIEYVSI